jgi:hypothetical protein
MMVRLSLFDQADTDVCAWALQAVGEIPVVLDLPLGQRDGRGVSIYLLDILPDPPARNGLPAPLQVVLCYLVSTWAETPAQAHALLGTLVFAALDHPRFRADLGPLSELWSACSLPPRPGFLLRVPVRQERVLRPVPPVREPIVVHATPLAVLRGVVLGNGGVPLAGARVEYPALKRSVTTDPDGRFMFEGVPAGDGSRELCVKARGHMFNITLLPTNLDEPVQIHADILEET